MTRFAETRWAAAVLAGAAATAAGTSPPVPPRPVPTRPAATRPSPTVDVTFVLDTTGSMSGLIDGAKAKIWHIANQIVQGDPRPVVRMGLVAYRDKGDEYVTKAFDLTDNIDQVYKDLMSFQANGGGDAPENVNQALHDAIHKMSWSKERRALRIIYLVGDCPPHNEYTDVPTYDRLSAEAIKRDIYINSILCGNNAEAGKVWQEIAKGAEGKFFAIDQSGGVIAVATPYDKELAELNRELLGTAVAYGDAAAHRRAGMLSEAAATMPAGSAADRAVFASRSGRVASGDLVLGVAAGDVDLANLEESKLPEDMRKMTPEQRAEHIAKLKAKREEIQKKVNELAAKRDAHIRQELEKSGKGKDAFDVKVVEALRVQAERKGIRY